MRTVLVIEDEVSVKNAICALLEREGWKVLHAATDAEAIEQAARNSVIDLLITDVVLRSGNGVAVARQMIQDRPELLCILISGYPMADLYNRELMDDDLLILAGRIPGEAFHSSCFAGFNRTHGQGSRLILGSIDGC